MLAHERHAGPRTISWQDLTVADAEAVRDFYQAVVGWEPESLRWAGTPIS